MTYGIEVAPNVFTEDNHFDLYELLTNTKNLKTQLVEGIEKVLDLMLNAGMTAVPDRKAVNFNCKFIRDGRYVDRVAEKIGTTFPNHEFANKCLHFAMEKVDRTIERSLICSYQNRSPENDQWGGSAGIVFKLFPSDSRFFYFTLVGAPSGLKEWEDTALFLGCLHYLGFIEFYDDQVQNILNVADLSVADQPEFLPDGMTIKQYVGKLFLKIDADLLSVA